MFKGVVCLGVVTTAAAFAWGVATAGEFDRSAGSIRATNETAVQVAQKDAPFLSYTRKMPTSGTDYELHMVQTRDEIYVPLGVRKPEGKGPFPAILIGSGNGRGGFVRVENVMYQLEPMMDEMVKRGYVVAFGNYRNEITNAYNEQNRAVNLPDTTGGTARAQKSACTLDSDDYIALIEHLQSLPYVKQDGVGTVGVSHTGELMLKAAAEITFGAAAPIEPAAHEFLALDRSDVPRIDGLIQMQDVELARKISDKPKAMDRIKRINTPFLEMGRDGDHNQGTFRLVYEFMKEAGKDVTWTSANHDVHGYGLLYRNPDGSYAPDKTQMDFFNNWMSFFDKHLKS